MVTLINFELAEVHKSKTQYGAVEQLLLKSEAQARKRVVCFLTVFTVTGFASELSGLLYFLLWQ